ncbi:MAG: hypothetical protein K6G03_07025, partial [Lachnospiraceae bacterium]|nr:hypothetical protein [Lachnospiraceae bacterium]
MMLDIIRKNEERIFCALFAYFIVTSFVNQQVYAFTVRFASVLIFLVLGVMALPYIKEHIKERDPDMILMLLTPVFTFIFALMSGSKMGAVFIPTDIALISYVSKYLRLSKKSV